MEIREQKAQKQSGGEDDLLNFDLDDLSLEEADQPAAPAEEEAVIELTDLVEKGAVSDQEGQDEIASLLEEDGAGGGTAEIELGTKELDGLEGLLKEEGKGKGDSALEMDDLSLDFSEEEKAPVEENVVEEEISDTDLAEILKEEGAEVLDLGGEEAVVKEEKGLAEFIPEADLAAAVEGLSLEEPAAVPAPEQAEPGEPVLDLSEEAAVEPEPIAPPVAESPPAVPEAAVLASQEAAPVLSGATEPLIRPAVEISEEKLEVVVTRVVQDVLERVVRETLETVAERVARETMETVVERVVRETLETVAEQVVRETLEAAVEKVARQAMAGAAERVILQAIDALKQSLESPSD
jgi:hypothetical protein